jgi:RHS repeat-associated protein
VKTAAGSDGAHAFSYDAAGNLTRETLNGADLRLYEYDAEGRLARAQLEPGATFTNYTYDADGQLVKLSGPKRMVYIDGIFEKNLDNGEITKYYFAEGRRVAMRTGSIVRYLAQDHLGSTAFVMNAAGALESHVRYYPYGMSWTQSATPATDRLFTGHQLMGAKSGTYYANARFYSADIGRFPQADTIVPGAANPQALNRYS